MKKSITILIAFITLCIIGFYSTYIVKENQLAIVTQFGKPVRIVESAGLHPKRPGFLESIHTFDKRADMFETRPTQLLLRDKKPIILSCYVVWKISDPLTYFQSLGSNENAVLKIDDIINSTLSIVFSNYTMEDIINTDSDSVLIPEIEQQITDIPNQNSRERYGIEVVQVGLQRLAYPDSVITAVYERMQSERVKEADKIIAEGVETAQKIRINADKEAREITAKATRQALILKGEGDSKAMAIYADAYHEGGEFFNFIQALESYNNILGSDTTMIISTDSELFKYLNLGTIDRVKE